MASVATLRARLESSLPECLSSTLLRERAAPLTVSTGIAALDALTGGLPRGALTEIAGPASSGRTGVMLAALAGGTCRQEVCALVDASDSFDPASAAAAGIDLERLLWVRCSDVPRRSFDAARTTRNRPKLKSPADFGFAFSGVLEQVLKVTDLLLQSSGFGMVVLDLGDIPPESARRVPLTSWFRFRRAVEPTTTVLLLVEQEPCARTCASLVVRLEREAVCARDSVPALTRSGWLVVAGGESELPENNAVGHAALLHGMRLCAQVVRSSTPSSVKPALAENSRSTQRKPAQPANVNFELRVTW